jgi:CSLREA domain-containing protein
LTNCTVSGNSVAGGGGGLFDGGGTTTLTNCTVSGNLAGPGGSGGGLGNYGGTTKLANTIVAGNTAGVNGPDVNGVFTSKGNNLVGDTDGSSGWVSSDRTGTIARPLNAELAPLGNYGGPTQTMPLLFGSPAIGGGDIDLVPAGIMTDQRGEPRFFHDRVDIGAYQLQVVIVPSFVVDTTADFSDPAEGKTSLREAIASVNALPGHTITFD